MKFLLNLLFISIIAVHANAVEIESGSESEKTITQSISLTGKVSDKLTGESLAGAEVQLIGTDEKTYTDFEGNFEFKKIAAGAQALKIRLITYEDIVKNVYVSANSEPLSIKLESKTK